MAVQVKVEGLEQAVAKLRQVRGALADAEVSRLLLEQGAKPIRSETERLAPRGATGQLKRSLVAKIGRGSRKAPTAFAAVDFSRITEPGAEERANRYPYIVEYGAAPHLIRPRKKRFLFLRLLGFAREVRHPGFRGVRYFRDAVARMRGPVKRGIEQALHKLIEDAAK